MKKFLVLLIALTLSGFASFAQMQPRIGYDYVVHKPFAEIIFSHTKVILLSFSCILLT